MKTIRYEDDDVVDYAEACPIVTRFFITGHYRYLPAAKCNGVDFLPDVSRAFTVCGVISFFTFARSPVLHASNSSRSGSLAMAAASRLTDSIDRLRLADISLSPISDASSFGRRFRCRFCVLQHHYSTLSCVTCWLLSSE
uniref:Uncharacterized protein n=1 Tax=Anopheles culicifacies TaxID=139723 RepID=A0A182LU25_9DIPT